MQLYPRSLDSAKPSTRSRFAIALAIVIVIGIVSAATPQFWGVAVLYTGVLVTAMAWLLVAGSAQWKTPPVIILVLVGTIALWGWAQCLVLGSATSAFTKRHALEWSIAAIAFVASTQILARREETRVFLQTILWCAASLSLAAIVQMYSSPGESLWIFSEQPWSVGTFLYKNQFAAMLELTIPIALSSIVIGAEQRIQGWIALIALLAGAVASGSRAGLTIVLGECICATAMAYHRKKVKFIQILFITPVIIALFGIITLVAGNEFVFKHYAEGQHDAIRPELLKSTLQMYKREPWSGYGLGSWSTVYPQYATFDIGRLANAAHNDWAEWAIEGGIIFVGSIFSLFALTVKRAITSVWGLGVIAIMLHSWVDYPTREPVLCVLWFCIAAALMTNGRQSLCVPSHKPDT